VTDRPWRGRCTTPSAPHLGVERRALRPVVVLREKKDRGFDPIPRVNRGVPVAEDDLIRTYRETIRPLYAFVSRRVGGDVELAEDLVQEAWLRALDTWPARGVPDQPLAWLLRVARNVMVSHFRRVRPELVDPISLDLEASGFMTDTPDAACLVSWGLARLRRGHAEVLEAFYFDGKTVREIAGEQGTSERAIEGRLRRARARLKSKLRHVVRPPVRRPATVGERGHDGQTRTS